MAKARHSDKQVSEYDKILQENIEGALPGLIKNILHINAVHSEELPDSLQHTKERKPDLLKKITDERGSVFVLHIEFQTKNDAEIVYRMAEYWSMLLRKYKLPVKQYVMYIGEGLAEMATTLINEKSFFCYNLISFSAIDYRIFLYSDKAEEKIFAILANFGSDGVETAVSNIFTQVSQSAGGELERERRKNQLRILAQLRNLVPQKLNIMESVATFFKEENDIFYLRGVRKGREEQREEEKTGFVKNLLAAGKFTITEIANFAEVTEDFVLKIKDTL